MPIIAGPIDEQTTSLTSLTNQNASLTGARPSGPTRPCRFARGRRARLREVAVPPLTFDRAIAALPPATTVAARAGEVGAHVGAAEEPVPVTPHLVDFVGIPVDPVVMDH